MARVAESVVVEIQKAGSRPPFWMLHPVGGHVLFAHGFARLLDPDQPLLGIQALGIDGRREPLRSITQMADCYLEAMRQRQPRGPYYLGGPSFGGYVAYELAQRLQSAGEQVAMLCLFDAYGPDYPRRLPQPDHLRDWMRFLREMPAPERWKYLGHQLSARSRGLSSTWQFELGRRPGQDGPLRTAPEALLTPIERVVMANQQAAEGYRPQLYPGRIHLFRATRTPRDWPGRSFDDPYNGWVPYAAQGVESIAIDGTHQFIFDEPTVQQLAQEFSRQLERTQRMYG